MKTEKLNFKEIAICVLSGIICAAIGLLFMLAI